MAYLGNSPARSFISFERQVFTIVNSQTVYTLDHSVTNENDIRLVVNNIVQEPGSGKAYTATGTTLTLSAALVNGTDEMYCVFLGRATATNAPGAGSVGTAQIADDAVTTAKLNDASVSLAKLTATGTKDATTFLRGDNTFAAAGLNGWSEDGANNNLLPASASAGIYLGVNSATAANLLDDYEEGTWTPTFTSGGNTLTITGGTQNYKYTKIGRQVFIEFNIENSTVSGTTATGDNRITLPFTSSNSGRNPVSIVSYFSTGGLRYTGAEILYGEINRNSSFVQLEEWVPNTGYRNISVAPTTGSGTYFWFCATYTVD